MAYVRLKELGCETLYQFLIVYYISLLYLCFRVFQILSSQVSFIFILAIYSDNKTILQDNGVTYMTKKQSCKCRHAT